jgi:hypothetical protein
MPGFVTDPRFWAGVLVGYLLVSFVPALSVNATVRGRVKAG